MAKKENEGSREIKHNNKADLKEAGTKTAETKEENTKLKTEAAKEKKNPENPGINKNYKTENCKILDFNTATKELDIEFKGYGIRLHYPGVINSGYITVRYYGEIGKPGFKCQAQEEECVHTVVKNL